MSDPKCGRPLLEAAGRNILTLKEMTARVPDESFGFTPYAVQFRYEGLGPGHEPIDRPAALARVEELVRHVRDRLAEVG